MLAEFETGPKQANNPVIMNRISVAIWREQVDNALLWASAECMCSTVERCEHMRQIRGQIRVT